MGLHHRPFSPDQATEPDHGQSMSRGYRAVYAVHRTTVPTLLSTPNLSDSATPSAAVSAIIKESVLTWRASSSRLASHRSSIDLFPVPPVTPALFVGSSVKLKTSSGPHLHSNPLRGWHVSSPGYPLRGFRGFNPEPPDVLCMQCREAQCCGPASVWFFLVNRSREPQLGSIQLPSFCPTAQACSPSFFGERLLLWHARLLVAAW